jgi:hypothetical protein
VTGGAPEAAGTPQPTDRLPGPTADAAEIEAAASNLDATRFAHASEAEMARILDFYQVRWEYEPTTFPILWNLDGDVVESFAPDFYLPDLEVFLEMTTLRQRLVRKKNRKLRRLRELYPDIRIKLFYARDFRAMMLKYGRFGLLASLSGTSGQVVPARPAPVDELPVILDAELDPELVANLDVDLAAGLEPRLDEAHAAPPELASPPVPAAAAPVEPADPAAATSQPAAAQPVPATILPVAAGDESVRAADQVRPRATPRTRTGRRRRPARAPVQAGAEREAGA